MSQKFPPRPDPDWYRKSAKKKLRELRKTNPAAKLTEAQLAIARKFGFPSWRKFQANILIARDANQPVPADDAEIPRMIGAIERGNVKTLKRLLSARPALAKAGHALHEAAGHNQPKIVNLLIDAGSDPTAMFKQSGHTPLSWAVTVGSFAGAEALVGRGIKPDLFCAAGIGSLKDVESFFDNEGNLIAHASQTGSTRYAPDGSRLPCPPRKSREIISDALYIAARNGRADVARFLVNKDADPNFPAYMAATPLHWAYFNGSLKLIDLLLTAGGDAALPDGTSGYAPRAFGICIPASWGYIHLVKARLKQDPSLVNILDGRGSPLHRAAEAGNIEMINLLLRAGADTTALDRAGKIPAQLARENNHPDAEGLLRQWPGHGPKIARRPKRKSMPRI